MNIKDYFFCYSTNLMEFLRYEKGINFICVGTHKGTGKDFWLFERAEVVEALNEYRERGKELGLTDKE